MISRMPKFLKAAKGSARAFGLVLLAAGLLAAGGALRATAQEGNALDPSQVQLPGEDNKPLETQDAAAGVLLLPDPPGEDVKGEKCMTVCARWGEECLLINKGRGGQERKCRRTCKQFAEECF
ncbi:MAG: hypothetical protein HYR49_07800 [Gammaproteobacteria bacterium]|nr:hypothetical protein [Gammaproteobacteria bacterium]